ERHSICCNIQSKLFELISSQAEGIERYILFEGIILALLYYAKQSNIENSLCYESCGMLQQPLELEKIEATKIYILQHLEQNITIPIIAKAVGTNECYLKKGFKAIVGKTIFEFLQENRMQKAQHLLKNTNKKLLEVAEMVGYASISSFSQAFKFYFGVSPRTISKE
ncbi:MAG: helix-turn-helix transcriptional regulator, partial [Chitinophagaceae bacterium]